jgi:hypothetical protein
LGLPEAFTSDSLNALNQEECRRERVRRRRARAARTSGAVFLFHHFRFVLTGIGEDLIIAWR